MTFNDHHDNLALASELNDTTTKLHTIPLPMGQ